MADTDTWMPLYVDDYLGDTQRLTCEQHGAYLLLILDYWRNGPPPDDDEVLMQITRLDRTRWKKNRPAIASKFKVEQGAWNHSRIDREKVRAGEISEKRKAAGKAGADKRWHGKGNSEAIANGMANASQTQSQNDRQPQPQPQSQEEEENTTLPIPHRALAFSGGVIRVNQREYDSWAATYHGIPDLRATLAALDEWIVECAASDHTVTARWKRMVTSRLDRKHQEWLAEMRKPDDDEARFTGPC